MAFQVTPVTTALWVKGTSSAQSVGEFRGQVLCIAMQDTDPVAATATETESLHNDVEGLSGWGSTAFLVADPDKPAPVWVSKADVNEHGLGDLPDE